MTDERKEELKALIKNKKEIIEREQYELYLLQVIFRDELDYSSIDEFYTWLVHKNDKIIHEYYDIDYFKENLPIFYNHCLCNSNYFYIGKKLYRMNYFLSIVNGQRKLGKIDDEIVDSIKLEFMKNNFGGFFYQIKGES